MSIIDFTDRASSIRHRTTRRRWRPWSPPATASRQRDRLVDQFLRDLMTLDEQEPQAVEELAHCARHLVQRLNGELEPAASDALEVLGPNDVQ